jgi:RNA polymerase sigma-70 factor (ECF subfamily)
VNAPPDASNDSAPPVGERLGAHTRRLRLLVRQLLGAELRARVEPEDLMQEVFLRALSTRELPAHAPGDQHLARLLARIARNVVVDFARAAHAAKRDGRPERLDRSTWSRFGDPAERLRDLAPGPATHVAASEGEARIQAAFDGLSDDHREVLALRQFEGLSARETAERLGRTETAVHSLYRRALQAWEQALDGAPPPL